MYDLQIDQKNLNLNHKSLIESKIDSNLERFQNHESECPWLVLITIFKCISNS